MKNKLLLFPLLIIISACGLKPESTEISSENEQYYSGNHYEFGMDKRVINIFFKRSDKFKKNSGTPPALQLPLDQPFLKIAKDEPNVKYKYGSFKFAENPQEACGTLNIKDIDTAPKALVIQGDLCGNTFTMTMRIEEEQTLDIDIQLSDPSYNRLSLVLISDAEEKIFGMGEQFSHVNMRGHRVPMWVEEQGVGRGDQPLTALANRQMSGGNAYTTYAPVPFYMTTAKKSFQLHNTTRSVFDFQYANTIEIEVWDNKFSATIQQMDDPLDLLEDYTEKTGRLPALPKWAYGNILGIQGGEEVVLNQLKVLKKAKVPVDAIWIQDWCGKRETELGSQLHWNWEADESLYPNFKIFCLKMRQRGIRVLGYNNPFLMKDGTLAQTAMEGGFFVKNEAGEPYPIEMPDAEVYMLDLTNPEAFEWMKGIIKENMINQGLAGWMADYAEGLPWDAVLHSGISAQEYHNQYPVDWARLNREAINETGNEGFLAFFSRSSFMGGNQHSTLYWAGDQTTYWQPNDGLPSVVPALLSSGMSGMAINHADIGGFMSFTRMNGRVKIVRNEELLKRWIELCAFTPVFRSHEGILPDENLQVYDAEMHEFYTRFVRIHQRLRPYLEAQVEAATVKGYPVVRHLYLHYPDDKNTYDLQQQYLLGEDVLVAPVVKKGARNVEVYIPEGEWRHLFTGETFSGGLIYKMDAPIGTPAVFVNMNSKWKGLIIE